MKLTSKLALGFATVVLLSVIVGSIGIAGMQKSHEAGRNMYENNVLGLEYLGKASSAFMQVRLECHKIVVNSLYDDIRSAMDCKEHFDECVREFEYWMGKSYSVAVTDELVRFHDMILFTFREEYLYYADEINKTSLADVPDHYNKLYVSASLASNIHVGAQIENYLIGLMDLNSALSKQASDNDMDAAQSFMRAQMLILAASIAVAVLVTIYIIRSIAMPVNEAASALEKISAGSFEVRVRSDQKGVMGTLLNAVNDTAEKLSLYLVDKLLAEGSAHNAEIEKARVEAASEAIFASMEYASKIQRALLPRDEELERAFSDYSTIWKPRDMVGGDIYWIRNYAGGTILCVCDCTGHGTSGAMLSMLVISSLESIVTEENYTDTAQVLWMLDRRISRALHAQSPGKCSLDDPEGIRDGCDLAVINIMKSGDVSISSGRTSVFICDGREVRRIRGQRISVGEGCLSGREGVETVLVPANPDNKFYIASDGLYDQMGEKTRRPFGYGTFERLILEHHDKPQVIITDKIWQAFENYRGGQARRDDFELVTFKP